MPCKLRRPALPKPPFSRYQKLGRTLDAASHNPADPDPWLALYLDDSLPIDHRAKAALLHGLDSFSRRALLPISKPFIMVFFGMVKLFRHLFPNWPHGPKALHHFIHWGLKTFASPEANLLILRHFTIGTELLQFIKDNVRQALPDLEIETVPLRPKTLADLKDDVFLQHDLNIYNFVIQLNAGFADYGADFPAPEEVDFSAITDGPLVFDDLPTGRLNKIDVETAIEYYTPVYCLFLSRHDFVRAANSLQLDETIGIYVARILGQDYHMSLINNRHPLVPHSTWQAGFRLMMHGYDAEALHGYLRLLKRQQAAAQEA